MRSSTFVGTNDPLARAWSHARDEHVFLLRCEGVPLRDIAVRLGISRARTTALSERHAGRLRKALRQTKFTINPKEKPDA